jgi:hypothetical protein
VHSLFFSSYLVWQGGLHFAQYCIVQCYMCLIVRTHIIAIKETVWRYTLNCALFVFFELSCMVRWTSFCTIFYCTMLYLSNTVRTHIIAIKETVWRYTLNCALFCFFRVILFGKVDFILHNIVLYNVICV